MPGASRHSERGQTRKLGLDDGPGSAAVFSRFLAAKFAYRTEYGTEA